jgi:hypothetical protein
MGPVNQDRVSPWEWRALAGIEAGTLGGLAMLGWLVLSSVLNLHSGSELPNFLGSWLNGRPLLHHGFGWATISGLGLHLFISGLIGVLFGLAVGDSRNRFRVMLLAILTGLAWYYFSQVFFWRNIGVLITVYSPPRSMLVGHLFFGLVLGRFPDGLLSLRRNFLAEVAANVETSETAAAPGAVE